VRLCLRVCVCHGGVCSGHVAVALCFPAVRARVSSSMHAGHIAAYIYTRSLSIDHCHHPDGLIRAWGTGGIEGRERRRHSSTRATRVIARRCSMLCVHVLPLCALRTSHVLSYILKIQHHVFNMRRTARCNAVAPSTSLASIQPVNQSSSSSSIVRAIITDFACNQCAHCSRDAR